MQRCTEQVVRVEVIVNVLISLPLPHGSFFSLSCLKTETSLASALGSRTLIVVLFSFQIQSSRDERKAHDHLICMIRFQGFHFHGGRANVQKRTYRCRLMVWLSREPAGEAPRGKLGEESQVLAFIAALLMIWKRKETARS
jgi:hypothetical protein